MALSRSEQMSRIHGEDTSPERLLCAALSQGGLAFDAHARTPVGRPDVVIPAAQVAVFIDGCFWHGCPDHATRPVANAKWWAAKLDKNIERDRATTTSLERRGWTVLRFWEHQDATEIAAEISRVVACARSGSGVLHPR